MLTLINKGKRPVTIQLDHEQVSMRYTQTSRAQGTGSLNLKRVTVSTPVSITLAAGEIKGGFPDTVAQLPDVLAAKSRGLVVFVSAESEVAEASATTSGKPKSFKTKGKQ